MNTSENDCQDLAATGLKSYNVFQDLACQVLKCYMFATQCPQVLTNNCTIQDLAFQVLKLFAGNSLIMFGLRLLVLVAAAAAAPDDSPSARYALPSLLRAALCCWTTFIHSSRTSGMVSFSSIASRKAALRGSSFDALGNVHVKSAEFKLGMIRFSA